MSKPTALLDDRDVVAYIHSAKGDSLSFRQVLDQLAAVVPFTEAFVAGVLPHGGLQIIQPQRLNENMLRSYSRGLGSYDRVSWQAIARRAPVTDDEVFQDGGSAQPFMKDFVGAFGYRHVLAVPLTNTVFEGYAGALVLLRTAEQGAFSADDIQHAQSVGQALDQALAEGRTARTTEQNHSPLSHRVPARHFIFNSKLESVLPASDLDALDDRLRQAMLDHARSVLQHLPPETNDGTAGEDASSDRVALPDRHGDLWNFRVLVRRDFPALGNGPFVFFSIQPDCEDWAQLRPTDFAADAELSRLIPAIKFMRQQFHRSPVLTEIAQSVHLSPFHFHRRFTELLGITPKHLLLDCQIAEAKHQIVSGKKSLAEIAKSCGFAHQSHFTSRFKQATGLTPTRWRRLALVSASEQPNHA